MTNANDICVAPRGGVPGLDLSALPVVPDPEALDRQAGELSTAGARFRNSVDATAAGWKALAGPYHTPEQPQLLAAFGPAATVAEDVEDGTTAVASALSDFASMCRDVKARCDSLTGDAEKLSSRIELKGDEWATVPEIVDEQHRLLSELNSIKAQFSEAEQDCANRINGLHGGTRYVSADDPLAKADGSNVYAVDGRTLDALAAQGDLPWGAPVERAHLGGWLGAGQGAVDGAWELVAGAYSLTPLSLLWRPEVRDLDLKTANFGEAWTGVGKTLWNLGMFVSPGVWLDRAVTGRQDEQDAAGAELAQIGPELIEADSWAKGEWEFALGRNGFDAVAFLASMGTSSGLKASSLSTRLGLRLGEVGRAAAWGEKVTGLAKLGELRPATVAKITDAVASVKVAAWEHVVKPGLDGSVNVLNSLDDGAGAVRVADGVSGMSQGPLGHMADSLDARVTRWDREVHRPPSIGEGHAGVGRENVERLIPQPLHDHAKPGVTQLILVPDELVPGKRTRWTNRVDGFAPNTEYQVAGRGSFMTDSEGVIREIRIHKAKGEISPELNSPLPDMTYKVSGVEGDVTFVTGTNGHTVKASVDDLQLSDGRRSQSIQSSVGRASNAEVWNNLPPSPELNYQGGHLIARMFDGIPERINIVGMLKEVNQKVADAESFYTFESALKAKALEVPPPKIKLEINLIREPAMRTPSKVEVQAWCNDKPFFEREFVNIVGRK